MPVASQQRVSGTMRGRATRADAIRVSWLGVPKTERPLQRLSDGAGPWLGARHVITVPGPAAGDFHRRRVSNIPTSLWLRLPA